MGLVWACRQVEAGVVERGTGFPKLPHPWYYDGWGCWPGMYQGNLFGWREWCKPAPAMPTRFGGATCKEWQHNIYFSQPAKSALAQCSKWMGHPIQFLFIVTMLFTTLHFWDQVIMEAEEIQRNGNTLKTCVSTVEHMISCNWLIKLHWLMKFPLNFMLAILYIAVMFLVLETLVYPEGDGWGSNWKLGF